MTPLPNILLILADDHGQWATGCYGNREVRTPNLDYVAATGVQFTNAFTPCPVCSPARASLFTGRIPSQHGVHDFLAEDLTFSAYPWLADESLLSQLLQRQGYQTGLVGKWHATVDGHDPQRGFDTWVSYDVRKRGWQNQYEHRGDIDFTKQGQRITAHGFQSQFLTEEALAFLRQQDGACPFFLVVAPVDTHFPFAGQPERLAQPYRHPDRTHADIPLGEHSHLVAGNSPLPEDQHERVAQYYAGVSMIDHQVGTLLDYLEGQGILDNTIVIYTSDHGHMNGHHGLWGKGNATTPQNFYEESIRIPLLVRWPAGGLENAPSAEPVDHCDLFATLLDAAGVNLSAEETTRSNSPGQTLLPLLRGEAQAWRAYQCCEYGNARMITDLCYKLVRRYPPHAPAFSEEFFALELDPRETTNLIHEVAYRPVIERLSQQLDLFYTRYAHPAQAGTNILTLPPHNRFEPWRK